MFILLAHNISKLADISDYDVSVRINEREIDRFTVTGHLRANGWPTLLRKIADVADHKPRSEAKKK